MKADKKKKEQPPVIDTVIATLASLSIPFPTDREIIEELIAEMAKAYKRNGVVNVYMQNLYLQDKSNQEIMKTLVQVQGEMKTQEAYMSYLLKKLETK